MTNQMTCPFCGGEGEIRPDKYGRPFWNHDGCCKLFSKNGFAICALPLLSGMVSAVGREEWKARIAALMGKVPAPPGALPPMPVEGPKVKEDSGSPVPEEKKYVA